MRERDTMNDSNGYEDENEPPRRRRRGISWGDLFSDKGAAWTWRLIMTLVIGFYLNGSLEDLKKARQIDAIVENYKDLKSAVEKSTADITTKMNAIQTQNVEMARTLALTDQTLRDTILSRLRIAEEKLTDAARTDQMTATELARLQAQVLVLQEKVSQFEKTSGSKVR